MRKPFRFRARSGWPRCALPQGRSVPRPNEAPSTRRVPRRRRRCRVTAEKKTSGMHRAGSCPTGGCLETSWQATLLGRGPGERGGAQGLAGAQVGTGTAMIYHLLQVVAARPSSIGQAGWAWRRRSNSLSLSVTRCRSCRCCCGRGASEMVALRSRRSTSS